jgi:hypothetical protein
LEVGKTREIIKSVKKEEKQSSQTGTFNPSTGHKDLALDGRKYSNFRFWAGSGDGGGGSSAWDDQ